MARTRSRSRKGRNHTRHVRRTLKSTRRQRKQRKQRTQRKQTRRVRRTQGGDAPLSYSLAGDWSSKMSQGQGADYLKYHVGQHGGDAPVSSIGQMLDTSLRGPAHLAGLDKAYADIAGLKDQSGGKRSKRSKRTKRRTQGGALGYAPFGTPSMLLNAQGYQQAGMTPEWRTNVEFDAAKMRATVQ